VSRSTITSSTMSSTTESETDNGGGGVSGKYSSYIPCPQKTGPLLFYYFIFVFCQPTLTVFSVFTVKIRNEQRAIAICNKIYHLILKCPTTVQSTRKCSVQKKLATKMPWLWKPVRGPSRSLEMSPCDRAFIAIVYVITRARWQIIHFTGSFVRSFIYLFIYSFTFS